MFHGKQRYMSVASTILMQPVEDVHVLMCYGIVVLRDLHAMQVMNKPYSDRLWPSTPS
jgi:hypothetical protein